MNGLWLRLYTDLPDCIKLRRLSEGDQLCYVWCLCLHKECRLVGVAVKDLAWRLRLDPDDAAARLLRLQEARLLGEDLAPVGWSDRQYASDNSTGRVRKLRAKRRVVQRETAPKQDAETPPKRPCNGDVTPRAGAPSQETETETETDTEKKQPPSGSARLTGARGGEYFATEEWDTARYVAAFHAIPGFAGVSDAAILNALQVEPDPKYRSATWNDWVASVLGSTVQIASPVGMLRAFMRRARNDALPPGARGDDPVARARAELAAEGTP